MDHAHQVLITFSMGPSADCETHVRCASFVGVRSDSCKLQWTNDAPTLVRSLVEGGIKYLHTYLLSGKFELGNAFFSGSMKVRPTR